MKQIAPISPSEIINDLEKIIPEFVINAINNLLKQKYRGKSVNIKLKDICDEIGKTHPEYKDSNNLNSKGYLDFEPLYHKYGWNVSYDKPGYSENYDSFFTFVPSKDKK